MRDENKILWIKEMIENKKINFKLEHDTPFKRIIDSENIENIYFKFKELFSISLRITISYSDSMDSLKKGEHILKSNSDFCFECGERICFSFDGKSVKEYKLINKDNELYEKKIPCKKIKNYSFDIEVPSGILMFSDRFPCKKDLFENLENNRKSLNSNLGVYELSKKYSELNLLYMYVGNTSPSIYYKDGNMLIGLSGYNDDNEEDIPLIEDTEELGYIITDVHWVSIFDIEVYKKILIEKLGEQKGLSTFEEIINNTQDNYKIDILLKENVKKGKYRCTYLYDENKELSNEPNVFIKMEWIGDI